MRLVVTGFGPFGSIETNSSTLAVQSLKKLWDSLLCSSKDIPELIIFPNLEVSYCAVQNLMPIIWEGEPPDLVIHCGVSSGSSSIALETGAFDGPFCHADVLGQVCSDSSCGTFTPTALPLADACTMLNAAGHKCVLSVDPGTYLCDYIYHMSLQRGPDRTVFVHVPDVSNDLEADDLGEALLLFIIVLSRLMKLKIPAALSDFFDHKFQPLSADSTN
ncbi:unnamed protein product [Schistocephalus solidus]|uniref:Pyroglutamyl-peptidase 1 n=1 Tax=Schistocephalus solidus TaxID=70667 RepID=A0A0X3NV94_SCHSO|nr:unnamed protein product [Schistocephalus solidus]